MTTIATRVLYAEDGVTLVEREYGEQVDGVWQVCVDTAGDVVSRAATAEEAARFDTIVNPPAPSGLDAALAELAQPITITGTTVAAVRTSAEAELERIRDAVVAALTPA